MAVPVIMPKQGQSVESCIITKWHKKKGDRVEIGDILFSYETDKASFEEEAKVSGILLDVFFKEGDDVLCLTNVCVIGNEGESTEEFRPGLSSDEDKGARENQAGPGIEADRTGQPETKPQAQAGDGGPVKISPRARKLAEKLGVDYRYATPSGPDGRIVERDIDALRQSGLMFTAPAREEHLKDIPGGTIVGTGLGGRITTDDLDKGKWNEAYEQASAASAQGIYAASGQNAGTGSGECAQPLYEEVKISHMRKVIASAMHLSLSSTAQLTLNTSFDATDILEFRRKLKENGKITGLENITITDIIIYAVSRTLPGHKHLNAHLMDDRIRYFKNVNIGVATDTERGLMVPTLFCAEEKSLNEISVEVKKLVNDCRSGTINPDLLKNGSFTITNLGTLGIESFTPVLNPPQTGILGVNAIVQRVKEVDGEYIFYPAMGLSLTFDHRALDGAPAARFLMDLKNNLENFSILLVR
jgi:pyruvate dehydrogenase E2 component (dihydrolipoamide acetyltransferase)